MGTNSKLRSLIAPVTKEWDHLTLYFTSTSMSRVASSCRGSPPEIQDQLDKSRAYQLVDNGPTKNRLSTRNVCPTVVTRVPALNSSCRTDADCTSRPGHFCCPVGRHLFCLAGSPVKPVDTTHKPFLGVQRHCPTEPLQEFLPVKNCTKDVDCEPRICCPDGVTSYCRTALPKLQPRTSQAVKAIRNLVSYLQCSPPPPPSLDLFPKACKYSFDCFPNICCQEKGKKVCRPAKRSILRLLGYIN